MSGILQSLFAELRTQVGGNPRLRWGLLAIAGILLFWLWLVLADWRNALVDEYVQSVRQLERIRSLAGQNEWLLRAQAARELRAGLDAQLQRASTLGVAQATAQGFAQSLAQTFPGNIRVQGETPAEIGRDSGIWRVPVVLSGQLSPAQVLQLIRRVESQPNLVSIEQALILNRQAGSFSLTMAMYFRIEGSGDGHA